MTQYLSRTLSQNPALSKIALPKIALRGGMLLAVVATGCAVPVGPGNNAAPVVDRSVYSKPATPAPAPQPRPPAAAPVEVTPLPAPEPIVRQEPEQQVAVATPPATPEPEPAPQAEPPAPEPEPLPAPEPEGNRAVVALLDSAAEAVGEGQLDQAASALERALRIEPRNAGIWHDLGQIRLHQRQFSQTESMAEKSNGLSDSNALKARNWRLIAVARRARGDSAGADAAEAQAAIMER